MINFVEGCAVQRFKELLIPFTQVIFVDMKKPYSHLIQITKQP